MKLLLSFCLLFLSFFVFAQKEDSLISNYYLQLDSLNARVLELEKLNNKTSKSGLIENSDLSFFGILRVGEIDWNQKVLNPSTGEKEKLNSRFWTRALLYFNLDTKFNDHFSFRTSIFSHPYYAFGDASDSKLSILLNEFWLDYKPNNNNTFRLGRQNGSRIWSDQIGELFDFWNIDGISFISNKKVNKLNLDTKLGYFITNYVDNAPLKDQGKIYGFAVDLSKSDENKSFFISSGILKAEKMPNSFFSDIGNYYYAGDLAPDYTVWTNQLAIMFKNFANLKLSGNLYYNFENYKENPSSQLITDKQGNNSFTKDLNGNNIFNSSDVPDFRNQKFGFYVSSSINIPIAKKEFQAKLAYLYMEKYATLDYYSQYDLARWASTNVKGPEFMVSYRINKWIKIRSRSFFMKDIKGLNAIDENYKRSGNRSRLDLVISF